MGNEQSLLDSKHTIPQQPIILCSACNCGIPFISFERIDHIVHIEINCNTCMQVRSMEIDDYLRFIKETKTYHCTYNEEHSSNSSTYFCLICLQWLCQQCLIDHQKNKDFAAHQFFIRELHLFINCNDHIGQKIMYYCTTCNVSICNKCQKESHSDHSMNNYKDLSKIITSIEKKVSVKQFENIEKRNKKNYETLMKLLEKDSNLSQLKEDLQTAYEHNEANNKALMEILGIIKTNYELLKCVPCYELYMNIKNSFLLNNVDLTIDKQSLFDNCMKHIDYYNQNYIIQVKEREVKIEDIPPPMALNQDGGVTSSIKGHEEGISCMIQLKDERLITGSHDKIIKVWDVNPFKYIVTLNGHTNTVFSLYQLKDERLVSASFQKIKVWDISTWNCLATMTGHPNHIYSLVQLTNKQLVSAEGNHLHLWNMTRYTSHSILEGHSNTVYCVIELEDERIVSTSWDKTLKIWNVESMECTATLEGHTDCVACVIQLKDNRLVSGSKDQTIIFWDSNTLTQIGIIQVDNWVYSLLQFNNECLIVGVCQDLILCNVNQMQSINTMHEHNHCISGIVLLNDGRIVTCSADKTIKFWSL